MARFRQVRLVTANRQAGTLVRQRGVGLIEVLLAVVLMSIGFLAAARMQVQGMQFSQGAYFMSQATFMARDLADRMRSNRQGVRDGLYDGLETAAGTREPACVQSGSACTPADIATADAHAWSQYLHAPAGANGFIPLLPSGEQVAAVGRVTRDVATGVYAIELQWSEVRDDAEQAQSLTVQFMP